MAPHEKDGLDMVGIRCGNAEQSFGRFGQVAEAAEAHRGAGPCRDAGSGELITLRIRLAAT